MPLEDYRHKRKFAETPEPEGRGRRSRSKGIFVVQKHAAIHPHYDFRLAINGALVSWAVPKGPSMNPADKRLAIRTEDHPLEYAGFEGVIPEGQYGAGIVVVWDTGPYEPLDGKSSSEQLARGKIDVMLHGTKLRGGFTLLRTGMVSQKERWLLVKQRDEYAVSSWDIDSPRLDRSALTGRSMKEIENGRRKRRVVSVKLVSE
jgi:bifunctional non-homologous end joining protein LigD